MYSTAFRPIFWDMTPVDNFILDEKRLNLIYTSRQLTVICNREHNLVMPQDIRFILLNWHTAVCIQNTSLDFVVGTYFLDNLVNILVYKRLVADEPYFIQLINHLKEPREFA